jgi:hypothetical protein
MIQARHRPLDFVADLQAVMQSISDGMTETLSSVPMRQQPLVPNALLNLAVERVLDAEGPAATALILHRLGDLVVSGLRPHGADAIPLTGHDA